MRTTGFGLSAFLVAAGAILAWAVTYEAEGIDLNQVGIILFIVGLVLALLTVVLASTGRRTTMDRQRDVMVNGQPVVEHERDVIVEQDRQV